MLRKRPGFTLIELLVVIAIIAILAAILFPVFARARAKAQQNTCLSNVKQIMLGCLMYFSDWDQSMWYYNGAQNGTVGNGWPWLIYPYVKNSQLFLCPVPDINGITLAMCPPTGGTSTYMTNGSTPPIGSVGSTLEKLPYQSECWLIADKSVGGENQGPVGYGPNCGANTRVGKPHNLGCNVGLLDGHAKWMNYMDPLWGNCAYPPVADPKYAAIHHFWEGRD